MGLGKTLTMLAAIVATLKEAAAFKTSAASRTRPNVDDEEALHRSRATLVLVPSHSKYNQIQTSGTRLMFAATIVLIKSWTEEIHKFVLPIYYRSPC
jgi:hypothetical protein